MTTSAAKTTKTRIRKHCDWCWEFIEPGEKKVSYFDFSEAIEVRMHPECFEAMQRAVDYYDYLPTPGDYRRGCSCGEPAEFCSCKPNAKDDA